MSAGSSTPSGADDTLLHGRWLLVARVSWIALTILILVLNVAMVPRYDALLQAHCSLGPACFGIQLDAYDHQVFRQTGLSIGFLAGYQVMLDMVSILFCCALATLLYVRRSADRMALFCAFMLVLFGGSSFTGILQNALAPVSPAWFALISTLDILGQTSFLLFFLIFPSARFVPRWSRWTILLILAYWIVEVFFRSSFNNKNGDTPDNLVLFAFVLCVVAAQVYRYRKVSTPGERQQTKWVVYGSAVGLIGFVLVVGLASTLLPASVLNSAILSTFVADTIVYILLLLAPISIAFAILRSHLYDIDVIINRTLVYGSLTGILGALYAGLIIGLETLAGLFAKQADTNPVVLVISTLVIAALIQPARTRIQSLIDRRFYRRKFDAEKTLASFAATLQNEVDLGDLQEHLLAVVGETMQPASVSLWLRQPE